MKALSDHLQRLFTLLEGLEPLPVPVHEVLLFEVPRPATLDSGGRLLISKDMLRSPTDYASRFDDLLHAPLSWIHMVCYGVWKGAYIVGIELPNYTIERANPQGTDVNYAGPEKRVKDHGWNASEGLAISDQG
ncbi:MAG TPA: hypothetical protein VF952_05600 [Chloroflexia bacterium]|jgi:hypothetical protein